MGQPTKRELEPLFGAYGHAAYAAHSLERAVRLLLDVIGSERQKIGQEPLEFELDDPNSHKTLGTLFKDVLSAEYVTDAEQQLIWKAIRCRNVLFHSYWDAKHVQAMFTSRGRNWLIGDLRKQYKECRKADEIVSSMIDRFLAEYGTSIDELSKPLLERWQNDSEPPADVLH